MDVLIQCDWAGSECLLDYERRRMEDAGGGSACVYGGVNVLTQSQ